MKLLLDAHLVLWWLGNSRALPGLARQLIGDAENTVFVSAVTHWELWLKVSLGKLRLPADFAERLASESMEHLPLTALHAREVAELPWYHRDPFDRMLVAQARCEGLTLLTTDQDLANYGSPVRLLC
ncbi:MAG: type II toxin-antitoxin system VapC family toxin [Bryobacteraceae bacterium]